MVAMDDERELIVRSQNGDPEAFAALIREHERMIYSLLLPRFGRRGRSLISRRGMASGSGGQRFSDNDVRYRPHPAENVCSVFRNGGPIQFHAG
jgi:hypothetical protein